MKLNQREQLIHSVALKCYNANYLKIKVLGLDSFTYKYRISYIDNIQFQFSFVLTENKWSSSAPVGEQLNWGSYR